MPPPASIASNVAEWGSRRARRTPDKVLDRLTAPHVRVRRTHTFFTSTPVHRLKGADVHRTQSSSTALGGRPRADVPKMPGSPGLPHRKKGGGAKPREETRPKPPGARKPAKPGAPREAPQSPAARKPGTPRGRPTAKPAGTPPAGPCASPKAAPRSPRANGRLGGRIHTTSRPLACVPPPPGPCGSCRRKARRAARAQEAAAAAEAIEERARQDRREERRAKRRVEKAAEAAAAALASEAAERARAKAARRARRRVRARGTAAPVGQTSVVRTRGVLKDGTAQKPREAKAKNTVRFAPRAKVLFFQKGSSVGSET